MSGVRICCRLPSMDIRELGEILEHSTILRRKFETREDYFLPWCQNFLLIGFSDSRLIEIFRVQRNAAHRARTEVRDAFLIS